PCPCGRAGTDGPACTCGANDIARYRARLSGPLADRIDLHVTVAPVALSAMHSGDGESSAAVRTRVIEARERQRARNAGHAHVYANAQAPLRVLRAGDGVRADAHAWLVDAADRLHLSARGYARVLRVARTIADLDGVERVDKDAVAEALRFRGA
ncbi:MAG: ATP-binding protein, partial [Gemmatimonadaceae bacterium]|nr:ATP-binding protein [Gemmatimonadaceae bacterium]